MFSDSNQSKAFFTVDNLSIINEFLKENHFSVLYILVDENTKLFALPVLLKSIKNSISTVIIEINSGEENKNISTCLKVWQQLSDNNADRNSLLINLGGGVLCDIGGFSASAYKRGIAYVNLPTTLLSMVDASIGGKTGINMNLYKNQIGFFSQPQIVFIYPEFLKTLPENEFFNGYAEIIKHALVKDSVYWNEIKIKGFIELNNLIEKSVIIKNEITKQDPFEKNIRKILNFGHTIGHALEMLSPAILGKQLAHGEAIANGIICETFISFKLMGLPENEMIEITHFIKKLFSPISIKNNFYPDIFNLMTHDKKNAGGIIMMVLLKQIGKAVYDVKVDKDLIFESLRFLEER